MIFKYRRSLALMMAAGLASAGGFATPDAAVDGVITLVNATTEQQCIFDYEEQVQAFLAAIPDPQNWQRLGAAPLPTEPPATEPPATEPPATEPGSALEPPSPAPTEPAPQPTTEGLIVNLALDQVAAGVEPADAITVTGTSTEPAAPIDTATEQPAADPAAQ
jgi:hypothetical protein